MKKGSITFASIFIVLGNIVTGLRVQLREDFVQEDVLVSVNHDDHRNNRERRQIDDFPEFTNIIVDISTTERVSLRLQKSINIDVNLPVYTTIEGKVQKVPLDHVKNVALYKDTTNGASILLERIQDGIHRNNFSVFGTFHSPRGRFVIQSKDSNRHVISRVPEQTVVFEMESIKGNTIHQAAPTNTSKVQHRVRRQSQNYLVEVLIVVDYELYNFWYQMTSGSDSFRKIQAFDMIRQYMAYVLNEMDMRYSNIDRSDYSIGILGAGFYIADTPQKSSWSTNNVINGNQLVSSSTLDAFRTWTNNQILPPSDHIMGFTGFDLISNTGDGSGIAYTGALCSTSSRSLVEDRLTFISMTTATHELGHSLGSGHDGEGNFCSSSDNYVMSVTNRVTNEPIGANLWTFSPCSKNEIKSYIDGLPSNNCMTYETANSAPAVVDTPMAELYPPDMTCEYAMGEGSYVCRSLQDYSTLCITMFCNDPGTSQCYTVLPAEGTPCGKGKQLSNWINLKTCRLGKGCTVLPAEGTPCGKGKWCQSGQCVTSSQAPNDVEDDCPIGDQPYPIEGYNQTCTQIVANNPGACYSDYVRLRCCQSCYNAKTNVAGCEYGDADVNFCNAMSRFGCYSNEQFCCSKCAAIKNEQIPGCEFGDKLSSCLPANCPFYNADSRAGCCESCFDGTTVSTSTTSTTTTSTTTSTTTTPTTTTSTTSTTSTTPTTTPTTTTKTTTTTSTTRTTPTTTSTTSITTPSSATPTPSVTMTTTNDSVTMVTPAEEPVSDLIMIIAGIAGGIVLLVVVIVVVCVIIRKRGKKEKSGSNGTYDNIGFVENMPHHPPPRRSNSSVRAKPPPLKPVKPVFPLKKDKTETDGYMLPSSPDVHTVSNGVMYTAPDKSAIKPSQLTNPFLRHVTEGNTGTDQHKRNSKTIHYKRPSGIDQDESGNNSDIPDGQRKHSIDAYDSIGQVEENVAAGNGHIGHNGHIPTPYHKPYNVKTPALPERPSDKNRNKPEVPSKRPLKPMLPPGVHARNIERGVDNSAFTNEGHTPKQDNDYTSETDRKAPLAPPKPRPRTKKAQRNRNYSDNEQSDTYDITDGVGARKLPFKPPTKPVPRRNNNHSDLEQSDTYDTADAVDVRRLPLKPPTKPVPRRKPKQSVDSAAEDNVGFDSDDIEIQI